MLTSLHNHTTWSDGQPTIEEMIGGAQRLGITEIGISDHFVMHPRQVVEWSMPLDAFDDYVAALREAGSGTTDVTLRLGVEADYFPESHDDLRRILARHELDYVIGSVHYIDMFPLDESREHWESLSESEMNGMWRSYWELIRQMAQTGIYDFAGHLDLPKKFGFRPTEDLSEESGAALDAIADAAMAIEINTAGWSLPAHEAYPSPELLKAARLREIPLLINADAHRIDHLSRDFERARDLAREAGYTELSRYEKRKRHSSPLL